MSVLLDCFIQLNQVSSALLPWQGKSSACMLAAYSVNSYPCCRAAVESETPQATQYQYEVCMDSSFTTHSHSKNSLFEALLKRRDQGGSVGARAAPSF